MKIKNILLSVFALALFAAPLLAQEYDYHDSEYTGKIGTSLKQIHQDTVNKEKYLDVGTLFNYLKEDLPINLDKLQTKAANSIKDNKITPQEQYDLMLYCIEHKINNVLAVLLNAGFDPKIHKVLNANLAEGEEKYTPLADKAAELNAQALFIIDPPLTKKTMMPIGRDPLKERGIITVVDENGKIIQVSHRNASGLLIIKKFDDSVNNAAAELYISSLINNHNANSDIKMPEMPKGEAGIRYNNTPIQKLKLDMNKKK